MGVIVFDQERIVHAPVAAVFARLADIEGYNSWMPRKGSILRRTEQTSPGEVGLGTTYVDRAQTGLTPGEVIEFEPPERLTYHWWEPSKRGRPRVEGWPGYRLEARGDAITLVHHHARLESRSYYRPATPFLRWLATRERTAVLDALQASFLRPEER